MIIFLFGTQTLKADEWLGSDQEFMKELNSIKNPFEDGIPKPAPVFFVPKPVAQRPKEHKKPAEKAKSAVKKVIVKHKKIVLPKLDLQGVIVGGDVQQAIINEQIVPLHGTIQGAQVRAVTKEGVDLIFKGKKFFLKVE